MAESLTLELPDELVERLFSRARELGLIEEARRWAEVAGVAEYLGVSERRVHDFRSRGMPAKRIGRRLLFDLREVDEWLEGQKWAG